MSHHDPTLSADRKISPEACIHLLDDFKAMFAAAGVGMWTWDFNGTPVWSVAMKAMHGLDLGEPTPSMRTYIDQMVPRDKRYELEDAFWKARDEGSPVSMRYPIERRNGEMRWIQLNAEISKDRNSHQCLCGICRDVTDRVEIEVQLVEASREAHDLAELFDLSNDLLCVAGFDGYYQRVNPAWSKTLGYRTDELLGRPYLDLVHPDDVAKTHELEAQLQRENHSGKRFMNRYRCKDGSYKLIDWSWTADSHLKRIYGLARDMSAPGASALRPHGPSEDGPSAELEMAQFASTASHSMREPLRMMSRYLDLLQSRYPDAFDDKGRTYFGYVREGANRMTHLLEGLREYTGLSRVALEQEPVQLDEIFDRVLAQVHPAIKNNGVLIRRQSLPSVHGDAKRLELLVRHLLANALTYRRSGVTPEIRIEQLPAGEHRTGYVTFAVSDNGIGIDPLYDDVVFELFQRLHTHHEYPGNGVGLAVCRKIATQHHGSIDYESTVGQGSRFRVSLPSVVQGTLF